MSFRFLCLSTLGLLTLVFVLAAAPCGAEDLQWTESSYEDFKDGTFLDAGSNAYVSAKGRIQIITRWDFNGDGKLDVLIPAGHGYDEKSNTYIYLNKGGDIDGRARIELPASGSVDGLIRDFDHDGYNDLAVANYANSHFPQVDAFIYKGAPDGYSVDRRVDLPAFSAKGIAAGDFNHDGWEDLAIPCQWQDGLASALEGPKTSLIYWNSPEGFSKDRRLGLTFEGEETAACVAAGDLDSDATDDLMIATAKSTYIYLSTRESLQDQSKRIRWPMGLVACGIGDFNGDKAKDIVGCTTNSLVILYQANQEFNLDTAVRRPISSPKDIAVADFDSDGLDDIAVANYQAMEGTTWTDSYVFFGDGKDFSRREPVELPTLGAQAISAGDLNGDNYPEIVVSNRMAANYTSLLSYVFWNDHGIFRAANRTQLPTEDTSGNTIGDVNHDGKPDVVFFNVNGGVHDGPAPSHIYWGDGTRNFRKERSAEFISHHIFGFGHADLDDDGRIDLVLSQFVTLAGIPHSQNGVLVYWGEDQDFSTPSILMMDRSYGGVRIADINRDGWLDMLAGGRCIDPSDPEKAGMVIYWGSENGYSISRSRIINTGRKSLVRTPLLMDFNRDGWLDIAGQVIPDEGPNPGGPATIWWGGEGSFSEDRKTEIDFGRPEALMYPQGADFNRDGWLDILFPNRGGGDDFEKPSYIYYGSSDGFSNDNREIIMGTTPYDNAVADFDKDGWLDLFLCAYGAIEGNQPSLIYWGSRDGFGVRPRTELPTNGSSGSEALDYDGDGWLDLFIANHRQGGFTDRPIPHRHQTYSMIYWGGRRGFSPKWRLNIPAIGPSGLNVRDAGNSYDRGFYEDYISSPYHIEGNDIPRKIEWDAKTPHRTGVNFQLRSAETKEELETAVWKGLGAGKAGTHGLEVV